MMREDLMVQQQVDNLWQHFVGVICLNQTGRIQVKRVLPEFFDRWPTPEKFLRSRKATVIKVIKSLGFYNILPLFPKNIFISEVWSKFAKKLF